MKSIYLVEAASVGVAVLFAFKHRFVAGEKKISKCYEDDGK